jgi:hypothetical protein
MESLSSVEKEEALVEFKARMTEYVKTQEKVKTEQIMLCGSLMTSLSQESRDIVSQHVTFHKCYDREAAVYRPDKLMQLIALTHQNGVSEIANLQQKILDFKKLAMRLEQQPSETLFKYYERAKELNTRDANLATLEGTVPYIIGEAELAMVFINGLNDSCAYIKEEYARDGRMKVRDDFTSLKQAYEYCKSCFEARELSGRIPDKNETFKILSTCSDLLSKGQTKEATALIGKYTDTQPGKKKNKHRADNKNDDKAKQSAGPSRPCKHCKALKVNDSDSMHWDKDCPNMKMLSNLLKSKNKAKKRKASTVFGNNREDDSTGDSESEASTTMEDSQVDDDDDDDRSSAPTSIRKKQKYKHKKKSK